MRWLIYVYFNGANLWQSAKILAASCKFFADIPRASRKINEIEPRKRLDALWTGGKQGHSQAAAVLVLIRRFFHQFHSVLVNSAETHRPQGSAPGRPLPGAISFHIEMTWICVARRQAASLRVF
ncbi:hypothetical protein [Roseibium sp. LAB1]